MDLATMYSITYLTIITRAIIIKRKLGKNEEVEIMSLYKYKHLNCRMIARTSCKYYLELNEI